MTVLAALGIALLVPSAALGQAAPSPVGGAFSGGGVPNATTFGSAVSAPVFDGGALIGSTLNLGSHASMTVGLTQTGNIQLDGGSKLCVGGTGDCATSIERSAANTIAITANTAATFSGAVQAGTGQFTTPPTVPLDLAGKATNGAGAIGIKLSNINALSTEGAAIAALYSDYATTKEAYIDKDGVYATNGDAMAGQITMSSGTGTATVKTGSICTCVNATDTTAWGCSVSGTTLTATGTGSDVISYICVIKF